MISKRHLDMISTSGCTTHRQCRLKGPKAVALLVLSFLLLRTLLEIIAPAIVFPRDRWPSADRNDIPGFIYNYNHSKPQYYAKTNCAGCAGHTSVSNHQQSLARQSVYSRTGVSCKALFEGDTREQLKAKQYMSDNAVDIHTPEQLVRMTKDCKTFRRMRGYASEPMSKEEAEFPLAFSVLIKGDADQAERLLRAIYASQNYYCLHVDLKASPLVLSAMRGVASCFDNVFVARTLESVYWGHVSIMYAEMNCLEDLLRFNGWKYFINLSGQMFPAHSNRDLVRILRLYDGANDVEGTAKRSDHASVRIRNTHSWRLVKPIGLMVPTFWAKGAPPHNVTLYKGCHQVALTRAFVVYFLFAQQSRDLVEWLADTMVPDEYIWPTLNHNPRLHAPGSYKGVAETKSYTARYSLWFSYGDANALQQPWKCQGKWVRDICIFGVGDLEWLYHRPELFINKFHADFEWLTYDCMEELIHNRTMASLLGTVTFDPSYYLRLPFVANKSLVTSVDEALRYWT